MAPFVPSCCALARAFDMPMGACFTYAHVLSKNPTRAAQAHRLLGMAYLAQGKVGEAALAYRALTALEPNDPRGFMLLGKAERKAADLTAARAAFEEASRLTRPDDWEAVANLAALDMEAKAPDAAFARVSAGLEKSTQPARFHAVLGMLHVMAGELKKAEVALRTSVELDPRLPEAHRQLGQLLFQADRFADAQPELGRAVALEPKGWRSLPLQLLSAMAYEKTGDTQKAKRRYEEILDRDPRALIAANNLAALYADQGERLDDALKWARLVLEHRPDDAASQDTLGWVLTRRREFDEALPLLRAAAKTLPEEPLVRYHLGLALAGAGKKGPAKLQLEQAAALAQARGDKTLAVQARAALKAR